MLKRLKYKILKYLRAKKEEKQYVYWLHNLTNVSLQDNINTMPRPKKKLLRILGNGNSLKYVINSFEEECDYMVVNSHILHDSYYQIKPKYYVLSDPKFFDEQTKYWKILQSILHNTIWSMTLFVPWEHTRKIKLESTEYVHVEYVNQARYIGCDKYRKDLYEHNLAMPNVMNVLISAIYLSIYLGYSFIELYGVEHSWLKSLRVRNDNHVYREENHFYDNNLNKNINYIVLKDYRTGRYARLHEMLDEYARTFESYWELRALADKHNCHIVNMTPNSFIDAFERGTNNK